MDRCIATSFECVWQELVLLCAVIVLVIVLSLRPSLKLGCMSPRACLSDVVLSDRPAL